MTYQFKPKKELFFDSYNAAIRAAEEGLGIAIGVFPISNNKIREGRLTVLSDQFFHVGEAFYLVTPPQCLQARNLSNITELAERYIWRRQALVNWAKKMIIL